MRTKLGLIAFFLLLSCAGQAARQNVLLPSMREAWSAIRVRVLAEAALQDDSLVVQQEVEKADAALLLGDPSKLLAVNWPLIYNTSEGDIVRRLEAGRIGPGAAASLREEVRLFELSKGKYTRTIP